MPFYRMNWKEGCECGDVEYQGEDGGGNEYYRCKGCDAVIIKSPGSASEIEEGNDLKRMEKEPETSK